MAIADGRFMAVGSDADVVPLAGRATKVIDLAGRPALPGLIDNHLLGQLREVWIVLDRLINSFGGVRELAVLCG